MELPIESIAQANKLIGIGDLKLVRKSQRVYNKDRSVRNKRLFGPERHLPRSLFGVSLRAHHHHACRLKRLPLVNRRDDLSTKESEKTAPEAERRRYQVEGH